MAGRTPEETDRMVEKAIAAKDVDAVLDLFESDAVLIHPETGAEARGHAAIRDVMLAMFESDLRVDPVGEPKVWICGDIALVLSSWSLEATGPDGSSFSDTGTATDVMRRQADGTWRFVIDNPAGVRHGPAGAATTT